MRSILLAALLCVGSPAFALATAEQTAINLSPLASEKAVTIDKAQNFTGTCGPSVVRVLGVTSVTGDIFGIDIDSGKIIVRQLRKPEVILDSNNGMSDHTGISCIDYEGKSRLLVWSNCAGTACGDEYTFTVIDADNPKVLAPSGPIVTSCDEVCAYALTGNKLPLKMNGK
jgi:hypothetical protein